MKWERWEMRSPEITLHFLLWNQKTNSLITLSVSNQSSATGRKQRWEWKFKQLHKLLQFLFFYPFNAYNFQLTLLLPVSLSLFSEIKNWCKHIKPYTGYYGNNGLSLQPCLWLKHLYLPHCRAYYKLHICSFTAMIYT